MPDGGRTAFASLSYLMAVNDDWGFGPGVYGTAKGNYGGIFTAGFTAQRRWRLGANTHLATSLYVGAGGGLSSSELRFGGGLMLRPEISLRTEQGAWYSGISLAQIRFPGGNVRARPWASVWGGQRTLAASHRSTPGAVARARLAPGWASTRSPSRPRWPAARRPAAPRGLAAGGHVGLCRRRPAAVHRRRQLVGCGGFRRRQGRRGRLYGSAGPDRAGLAARQRAPWVSCAPAGNWRRPRRRRRRQHRQRLAAARGPSLRWVTPWGASLRLEGGATRSTAAPTR